MPERGVSVAIYLNQLPPAEIARLKAELAETLIANFCYPRFYDYRINGLRMRPVDRAKRQEVWHFLSSVDFGVWGRVDLLSPDFPRQVELLFIHFVQRNRSFFGEQGRRRMNDVRMLISTCAARVAEGMRGHLAGRSTNPPFGSPRPVISWAVTNISGRPELSWEQIVSSTMLLQQQLQEARGETTRGSIALPPPAEPQPPSLESARTGPIPTRRRRVPPGSNGDAPAARDAKQEASPARPATTDFPTPVAPSSTTISSKPGSGPLAPPASPAPQQYPAPASPPPLSPAAAYPSAPTGPTRRSDTLSSSPENPPASPMPTRRRSVPLEEVMTTPISGRAPAPAPSSPSPLSATIPPTPSVSPLPTPQVSPTPVAPTRARPVEAGMVNPSARDSAQSNAALANGDTHGAAKENQGLVAFMKDEDIMIFEQLQQHLIIWLRIEAIHTSIDIADRNALQLLELLHQSGSYEPERLQVVSTLLNMVSRVLSNGEASLLDYKQALMFYLMLTRRSR